ncbi:MAG: PHP domain-containing protein [Candidatus Diapherotrites archaeon]|nr:PHP domain-containing protein [Candidatus Diapherotrites archaeon]
MNLDLHLHTAHSVDAITKPSTLAKTMAKKNIGFAITDHNLVNAWKDLNRYCKELGIPFIQGEEVYAFHEGILVGEFIGLFLNEPIKSRQLFEIIDEVKGQGALLSVPHPFDVFRKGLGRHVHLLEQVKKQVDLVEAWNARCYSKGFNARAKKFAEENAITKIGVSDSHSPNELGNGFTLVEANDLDEARQALKNGKTQVYGRKAPLTVHMMTQFAKRKWIHPV